MKGARKEVWHWTSNSAIFGFTFWTWGLTQTYIELTGCRSARTPMFAHNYGRPIVFFLLPNMTSWMNTAARDVMNTARPNTFSQVTRHPATEKPTSGNRHWRYMIYRSKSNLLEIFTCSPSVRWTVDSLTTAGSAIVVLFEVSLFNPWCTIKPFPRFRPVWKAGLLIPICAGQGLTCKGLITFLQDFRNFRLAYWAPVLFLHCSNCEAEVRHVTQLISGVTSLVTTPRADGRLASASPEVWAQFLSTTPANVW